jgi:hypothetical protein
MSTLIEVSNDLAKKFIQADNKRHAAKHILNEINSLVYTSSKQSIDEGIKVLIVQIIQELISGKRAFKSEINEMPFAKPEHISIFVSASNKIFKKSTIEPSLSKRRRALTYLRHL